jgi:type 1 glutamine amidotransferase
MGSLPTQRFGIFTVAENQMSSLRSIIAAISLVTLAPAFAQTNAPSVLVFSKTTGFRHDSIPGAIEAIERLGKAHGFRVEASEDAAVFEGSRLQRHAAVIFLNTTGEVLDSPQQRSFEQFIRSGRGFVGIHSAADTEYDWPWYGRLVGGYFDGHDAIQNATIRRAHSFGSALLPTPWIRRDEWYNYKQLDPGVNVILTLDTKTFKGSKHGDEHPIAWYREFDGGRSFYTGFGHTAESYSEPAFLEHLLDGIRYAIGR